MRRLLILFLLRTMGEQHKAYPLWPCKYISFLTKMPSTRISSVSCIISIPSDYYLLFRVCSREKSKVLHFQASLRDRTYLCRQTLHHSKFHSLDIFLCENRILHSHHCTQTDRLYRKTQLYSLNIQVMFHFSVKAILDTWLLQRNAKRTHF